MCYLSIAIITFYNVLRNMFLQGTFPKSLEVSEKSLWSKQSKNCQDMYGLRILWTDTEIVYVNGCGIC
jgi:hypothetical protein